MVENVPDYLTILVLTVVTALFLGVTFGLLWARTRLDEDDVHGRSLALAAVLTVIFWYVLSCWLGSQNFFKASAASPLPPMISFGIMLPLILLGPVVFWSSVFSRLIDQFSQPVLVGFQIYRVAGVLFFVSLGAGLMPGVFVYPAGIGDILTGVFAGVVALIYLRARLAAASLVVAWNWFGIADLVVAVAVGYLSSPGPFHILSLDAPNHWISAYPFVLVPVFAVPMSILLHFCSLKKLKMDQAREGQ